jgi:hypothetical protein
MLAGQHSATSKARELRCARAPSPPPRAPQRWSFLARLPLGNLGAATSRPATLSARPNEATIRTTSGLVAFGPPLGVIR